MERVTIASTLGRAARAKPAIRSPRFHAAVLAMALAVISLRAQEPAQNPDPGFRFKSGVELVNVAASVVDASGRFVPGLRQEDFIVYEDDQPQPVTHFSAERVPVSLGIALDTSGSMAGERIQAAQSALSRFVYDLLDSEDEIFLYRFSDRAVLVQDWTSDRLFLGRALGRVVAHGTTAMYDAVAHAVRLAASGKHRKKALVLLSDGNDTSSTTTLRDVKKVIRETDALVYAIGIDCGIDSDRGVPQEPRWQRRGPIPIPIPSPFPRGRRGRPLPPPPPPSVPPRQGRTWSQGCSDPVDIGALREMTDDSGGRTEIIRHPRDLDFATAGIADELSKQYYLGYLSTGQKDGRWHSIRVEVRNGRYRIRARRGYFAS
jgi:VWFA-related protein